MLRCAQKSHVCQPSLGLKSEWGVSSKNICLLEVEEIVHICTEKSSFIILCEEGCMEVVTTPCERGYMVLCATSLKGGLMGCIEPPLKGCGKNWVLQNPVKILGFFAKPNLKALQFVAKILWNTSIRGFHKENPVKALGVSTKLCENTGVFTKRSENTRGFHKTCENT